MSDIKEVLQKALKAMEILEEKVKVRDEKITSLEQQLAIEGESTKELISAIRSINKSRQHNIKKDGDEFFIQRVEWVEWILEMAKETEEIQTKKIKTQMGFEVTKYNNADSSVSGWWCESEKTGKIKVEGKEPRACRGYSSQSHFESEFQRACSR